MSLKVCHRAVISDKSSGKNGYLVDKYKIPAILVDSLQKCGFYGKNNLIF